MSGREKNNQPIMIIRDLCTKANESKEEGMSTSDLESERQLHR